MQSLISLSNASLLVRGAMSPFLNTLPTALSKERT